MTDIPRGQGGDGSPQLDLDAMESKLTALLDSVAWSGGRAVGRATVRIALARVVPEKETR